VTLAAAEIISKIRTAFAPCTLGVWPTPLAAAHALGAEFGLAELWIKREDRSAAAYGGNKVRSLEFLLAGAPPDAVFVTIGGVGSTHCVATAVHARAIGRRAALAQFPQPETEVSRQLAAAARGAAAIVERARWRATFPAAIWRAWRGAGELGRPVWIAGGGAHPLAVVAQALGGLELAGQLGDPPEAIVAPLGSGGTAAGLCLAVGALGWPTRVIAVRVAPAVVANRWRVRRLAAGARRELARAGLGFAAGAQHWSLDIKDGLGRGYGHPTAAGLAATQVAARFGVELDPTYTAKAFAVIPRLVAAGFRRVVFWHTFALPPASMEHNR